MINNNFVNLILKSNLSRYLKQKISTRCLSVTPFLNKYSWIYRKQDIDKGKDFPSSFTFNKSKRPINFKESLITGEIEQLRHKYSEFLPTTDLRRRQKTKDSLERTDMLKRRTVIDIPEFYVGSILAVTVSDPFAKGKVSKFVGLCISREGNGLMASFTLRNVVDREGIEIRYDLYNPTIRSIEVLKLEKREDPHLFYLRDAEPEYSTIPFNMEPEIRKEDEPVPVNKIKVKMLPYPWSKKWFKQYPELVGFEKMEKVPSFAFAISQKEKMLKKYDKFDLMKEYRSHIPEEDQLEIWKEIAVHEEEVKTERRKIRRRRLLQLDDENK